MRWVLGVVNDTQTGQKPRVARLIGWKTVFSCLKQGQDQEYPNARKCKFWGMMTIVCLIFHVPLCTPEGDPRAPEVTQSGKMFYPPPALIQRKADGVLQVNCIDPVGGDVCGTSNPAHFPVGVNVTRWQIFLNQFSTCPYQGHIQGLFNFINVLVVIKELVWCPWPFWESFCRIL